MNALACAAIAGKHPPGQYPIPASLTLFYGSVTAPRSAPVTSRAYLASTPVV